MSLQNYKRRAEATHFEDQTFERLDLRSMKAFGSTWTNCTFKECQLDLADWRASKFERVLFEDCSMRLVNFATSFFDNGFFRDCDLEQASFMGSHFTDLSFAHCRLAYGETLFQDVTAKGSNWLRDCNLHGSNLDFRQVEKDSTTFTDCNLWAAKLSMGCQFWNAHFDNRTIQQFLALVARSAQDPRIAELAGDQYRVVCRAMDGAKGGEHETTATQTAPLRVVSMTGTADV